MDNVACTLTQAFQAALQPFDLKLRALTQDNLELQRRVTQLEAANKTMQEDNRTIEGLLSDDSAEIAHLRLRLKHLESPEGASGLCAVPDLLKLQARVGLLEEQLLQLIDTVLQGQGVSNDVDEKMNGFKEDAHDFSSSAKPSALLSSTPPASHHLNSSTPSSRAFGAHTPPAQSPFDPSAPSSSSSATGSTTGSPPPALDHPSRRVYAREFLYSLAGKGTDCPVLVEEILSPYQPPAASHLPPPVPPKPPVNPTTDNLPQKLAENLERSYAALAKAIIVEEERQRGETVLMQRAVKLLLEYQLAPAVALLKREATSSEVYAAVLREIRALEIPTGRLRVALGLRPNEFTMDATMIALVNRNCSCGGHGVCLICLTKDSPMEGVLLTNALISKLKSSHDQWKTSIFGPGALLKTESKGLTPSTPNASSSSSFQPHAQQPTTAQSPAPPKPAPAPSAHSSPPQNHHPPSFSTAFTSQSPYPSSSTTFAQDTRTQIHAPIPGSGKGRFRPSGPNQNSGFSQPFAARSLQGNRQPARAAGEGRGGRPISAPKKAGGLDMFLRSRKR